MDRTCYKLLTFHMIRTNISDTSINIREYKLCFHLLAV